MALTHHPDLNMLIYLQLATVHICMLCASSEKSIIFFRRGWCICPSVKFGLYSDNGLHPFGPKSNIYGTLTTVLIHRDPIANSLAILPYGKNTGRGSNDYSLKKWSVNMPVIPRNWEPTSWKCQSKVLVRVKWTNNDLSLTRCSRHVLTSLVPRPGSITCRST